MISRQHKLSAIIESAQELQETESSRVWQAKVQYLRTLVDELAEDLAAADLQNTLNLLGQHHLVLDKKVVGRPMLPWNEKTLAGFTLAIYNNQPDGHDRYYLVNLPQHIRIDLRPLTGTDLVSLLSIYQTNFPSKVVFISPGDPDDDSVA